MCKRLKTLSVLLSALIASSVFSASLSGAESAFTYREVDFHDIKINGGEPVKGADISSVISLENSGVVFKNENGDPQDIFLTLKEAGVNYIRVRVWNEPYDENGNTYGGGANDIETAVKIAQRCAEYDLKLLVDFHYSDFWADPSEQQVPKSWKNYSAEQKADAIRSFTQESLQKISATGVKIGMVQIGNETVSGLSGETEWENIAKLMNAGSETVRKFDRNILVVLHFTNPDRDGFYKWIADTLAKYKVDYDVFATSYYPFWHGTLQNLTDQLSYVADTYGKYVMAAETSWANTLEDADNSTNTVDKTTDLGAGKNYDISIQGQIDSVSDVFQAVSDVGEKGIGVFYWEPAWIRVGEDYQKNKELWDKYGSGACATGSGNFSTWTGKAEGSGVDNQALFDQDGKPLDSLYVFNHIHSSSSGNYITNPGFEKDGYTLSPSGWKITDTTSGEYAKFEVDSEQNRTGEYAAHWYSPNDFKESRLTGEFKVSETGDYTFLGYLSGENATYTADIYVNGQWVAKDTGEVSGYGTWNKARVKFHANSGDTVKVEFIINGWSGSYGSVDDCSLYLNEKAPEKDRPQHEKNPVQEKKHRKGDINLDEKVDSSDLISMRNHMLGKEDVKREDTDPADINGDGKIDITDVILLKGLILGDIPENFTDLSH